MSTFVRKATMNMNIPASLSGTLNNSTPKTGIAEQLALPKEVERMSFLSFDEVQPKIKDIHQNYQTDIVTDLSKISQETSRIIKNLTEIEGEINTYQTQIDDWSDRIGKLTEQCESMQHLQGIFEGRLGNMEKLSKEVKMKLKR